MGGFGGGGGGNNPLFEPFYDSLRIAVPLVTQQRQIDAMKQRQDQEYMMHKQELLDKAQQAQREVEVKTTMEMFKGAMEAVKPEDPESVFRARAVATQLEKSIGKPVFPRDETGELVLPGLTWAKPGKGVQDKISPLGQLIKERDMLPEGDPRRKQYDDVIARQGKAPETNVNVGVNNIPPGNQPLEKSPKSKTQEDVMVINDQLGKLESIGKTFMPKYLTYWGRFNEGVLEKKEKLGLKLDSDEKDFIGGMAAFKGQVDRLFNIYRKDITGAAAAMAELERLQKALISMEMSPTQFENAYNTYVNELKRTLRLKNGFLRKGIDIKEKEGGSQFDDAFLSGGDDDIGTRGEELKAKYPKKNDQEIADILIREGYQIK